MFFHLSMHTNLYMQRQKLQSCTSSIWMLELWSQLKIKILRKKNKITASSDWELSVHRLLIFTNSFVSHSYLRSAFSSHLIIDLCSLFFCNICLYLHLISLVGRWSHCKAPLCLLVLGLKHSSLLGSLIQPKAETPIFSGLREHSLFPGITTCFVFIQWILGV